MARVLVIGLAVVDFVFEVEAIPDAARKYRAEEARIVGGGCAANAAVAIARLGGEAILITRLGDDAVGRLVMDELRAEGVDISRVQVTAGGRSAFSSVCIDTAGERQIVNFRGAGLSDASGGIADVPKIDAVLVDTRWEAGALAGLNLAQKLGVPGVLDAEPPVDRELITRASHAAFSRDGLRSMDDEREHVSVLQSIADRYGSWVCVTDGANGVQAVRDGVVTHTPAFEVDVRDTLGAGDIWHGAFALSLAAGEDESIAVRHANAAAAIKCSRTGGRSGAPSRTELDEFLKERSA